MKYECRRLGDVDDRADVLSALSSVSSISVLEERLIAAQGV